MAASPRYTAFAAACLLLAASMSIGVADARKSSSRNLRSLLRRNAVGGLQKMRTLKEQHDSLVLSPADDRDSPSKRKFRSIMALLDLDGVQRRSLEGSSKTSKSSKGGGKGYYPTGKGSGKGSKSKKSKKCKGKGKDGKGKGGSKRSKSSKGSCDGDDETPVYPDLPEICGQLDFSGAYSELPSFEEYGDFADLYGYDNTGNGYKHRTLAHRELQMDGPLCDPNVLDTARNIPSLSIFVSFVEEAGLEEIFFCAGPFTVLPPSNAAFAADPDLVNYLADSGNVEDLREVLLYHILPGLYLTDDFEFGTTETLLGESIIVELAPLTFNGASVVEGNLLGCNGVLNAIDEVLLPPGFSILPDLPEICSSLDFREVTDRRQLQLEGPLCDPNVLDTARSNSELSTFVQLLEIAGLTDIFVCPGPFTLMCPLNAAFDALDPALVQELLQPENLEKLQDLLLYHMLPGLWLSEDLEDGPLETLLEGQTVDVTTVPLMFNQARVVDADILACNGALQIIDDVLVPETDACNLFDFGSDVGPNCMPSVTDVAAQYPELTLVSALIERAELSDIFLCPGPFTALLPTNAAFDAVDPVFLEFLLRPENQEALEDVLLYHILPGAIRTNELQSGTLETLLPGEVITVEIFPVMFNDAAVETADIEACNGIIDTIDSVLLPFDPPTAAPVSLPTIATPAPSVAKDETIAPTSFCDMFDFEEPESGQENCMPTVLEVSRQNPDLSLAFILFERAQLTDIFSCPGPFTLLIPTNAAIENVDASLIEFLLQPENRAELQNLMLYHVLPGFFPSSSLSDGLFIDTLFTNRDVEVSVTPDGTLFNDATVQTADTPGCNGIFYTLSEVLTFLPPSPTSAPTDSPTGSPTVSPTQNPTPTPGSPTTSPVTASPVTASPVTAAPTESPTQNPTPTPGSPTTSPVTATPTGSPTAAPTGSPTQNPTPTPGSPTTSPVTAAPTGSPSQPEEIITATPTAAPTVSPTQNPTPTPGSPTTAPVTEGPSAGPSIGDSPSPSPSGTLEPSAAGNNETLAPSASPVPTGAGNATTDGPSLSPAPTVSPAPSVSPVPTGGGNVTSTVPSQSPAPSVSPVPTGAGNSTSSVPDQPEPTASPAPSSAANGTSAVPSLSPAPNASLVPTIVGNDTAPSISPAPTGTPVLRSRVGNYFLAYQTNQDPLVEPTPEEYAQQARDVHQFFEDVWTTQVAANQTDFTFLGVEFVLDFTLFEAGIPDLNFSLYMDYAYMDLIYTANSTGFPDPAESFDILQDSLSQDFIRFSVRNTTGAFSTVSRVVFRASVTENPEERAGIQDRSGSEAEEESSLPVGTLAAASGAALIILAAGIIVYRRTREPQDDMDGIYALDNKAVEGYFSERSVTEEASDNASRFPPMGIVTESRYEDDEHQPLRV